MRVVGGGQPARSAPPRRDRGLVGTGEQQGGQPLEVALAHPAARGELVGVPGDAGGRQLVDVGEHQLGEPGHRARRHPRVRGGAGHLAPGDPGAHPVRRLQGVHRPAAARLAASEVVRSLEGRTERGARVAVPRPCRASRVRNPPSAIWTAPVIVAPRSPVKAPAYDGTSAVTAATVAAATSGRRSRRVAATAGSRARCSEVARVVDVVRQLLSLPNNVGARFHLRRTRL